MSAESDRILSIQYLRGVATMGVVWMHAVYARPGFAESLGVPYFGGSPVDVFFVISGLVVALVATRHGPGRFFALRIIRVVPLYWLATLVAYAIGAWDRDATVSLGALLKSLLFIPYRSGPQGGLWPLIANGWTLNYEMFFYALFALALTLPRHVQRLALVTVLVSLVLWGRLAAPAPHSLLAFYTGPYLLEIAAGLLLAMLWSRVAARGIPVPSWLTLALALAGAATAIYALGGSHPQRLTMIGATLLVGSALHPRLRMLECRPLLALGDASYSIYLTHDFVLRPLSAAWTHLDGGTQGAAAWLYLAVAFLACAAAGWLCYRWVERPLLKGLRTWLARRDQAAAGRRTAEATAAGRA